jgi:hypothetical protein
MGIRMHFKQHQCITAPPADSSITYLVTFRRLPIKDDGLEGLSHQEDETQRAVVA